MARKKKFALDPPPALDLTPMIDIVFNLIIFFMIVSELSNLDVEQVELPFADSAEEAKPGGPGEDKILQVNVMETGLIKVRQKPYTADPQQKASGRHAWLGDMLEAEAAGYEREPPDPSNPNVQPSKLRINIRADKRSPFKHVQQVFDLCVKNGIYKTSLAATQDDPK
jgi:biopolymer transport protein ExbD